MSRTLQIAIMYKVRVNINIRPEHDLRKRKRTSDKKHASFCVFLQPKAKYKQTIFEGKKKFACPKN